MTKEAELIRTTTDNRTLIKYNLLWYLGQGSNCDVHLANSLNDEAEYFAIKSPRRIYKQTKMNFKTEKFEEIIQPSSSEETERITASLKRMYTNYRELDPQEECS